MSDYAPESASPNVGSEPHDTCPDQLRSGMAAMDTEVTVSTEPPLVAGPYITAPFVCPHGTAYWIEPTSEQIARWRREGVK